MWYMFKGNIIKDTCYRLSLIRLGSLEFKYSVACQAHPALEKIHVESPHSLNCGPNPVPWFSVTAVVCTDPTQLDEG